MKLNKLPLLLLLCATFLSGCGSSQIDCHSIKIYGSDDDSFFYQSSSLGVYEFVSDNNKKIYCIDDNYTKPLEVYKDISDNKPVVYNYSRFVGYLLAENNYYLDLNKRQIDCEFKISEYKDGVSVNEERPVNNKEAYRCALKGYYDGGFNVLYLKDDKIRLERHSYIQLGDNDRVEYTPKWY